VIDPDVFLGTIPIDARLPWDHIDVGLEPGFLAREYRKSLRNRLSPPCGKTIGNFVHHANVQDAEADQRRLVCYDCGVACDLTRMREERIEVLKSVDALEPRPRPPTPVEPEEKIDRRPFYGVDQGPVMRVRIGYRKLGRVAYASHLDLVRSFPRMLRRIGLPLYYSEGFRPLPRLTFGPALPVGTSSLCEHIDVRLRAAEMPTIDDLCAELNRVAIDGLEFFGHVELGPNDAALNRVLDEVEYVAALSRGDLRDLGVMDEHALQRRLNEPHDELTVWRDIRGIGKRVDVGAALISSVVGDGRDELERAGLAGNLLPIRITLRLDGKTTPRPAEVLRALTGVSDVEPRVVRTGFFARRASGRVGPLDIEALRHKTELEAAE
jgi:radical SAM-linked protein